MHHYVRQFGGFPLKKNLPVSAPHYVTMRQIIQLHDVSVEAGVEQVCYVNNILIKSPYHTAK